MWRRALTIGGLVLAVRLATLPRTPWDADEVRWLVPVSIAASVVTAVVIALREPVAALLFSFSAAVMVHAVTGTTDALSWMFLALAACSGPPASSPAEQAASRRRWVGRLLLALLALLTFPFARIPEELALPSDFSIARFTLHPWGSKLVFLPVLVVFAAGIRTMKRHEPLAWFALVHLAVGIAVIDPRDGARYAIPAMLFVALVAADGLKAMRVPWIGAAVIVAVSVAYVFPLLRERVVRPSPWSLAMRAPRGTVFARGDADAWGKLTRIPRRVSLPPVPDFEPGVGVFGVEQNEAGESWRWLKKHAELQAPSPMRITLRLPAEAKIESNDVRVNGALVRMRRGESVTVAAPARVEIDASRAFPLDPPDTRSVAVQLVRVER
jgi:hypothetical protein